MKLNINFLQTGGVPLTNDLMSNIMEAIQLYDALGELAGNLSIIAGCEIVGSTVSSGVVAINGEVLYFEGGLISSTVYINSEQITKTFEDQTDKVLIEKKTVRFGNATTAYLWSDFVKLKTIRQIQSEMTGFATQTALNALIAEVEILKQKTAPIVNGGIVWAFRGTEIPLGWKECLDIRGKTIVGWNPNESEFSSLGVPYGSKTHTLSKSELPNISGDFETITGSGYGGSGNGYISVLSGFAAYILGSNNGQFQHKTLRLNFGGNQPHNNIQPSMPLKYIEPNFQ